MSAVRDRRGQRIPRKSRQPKPGRVAQWVFDLANAKSKSLRLQIIALHVPHRLQDLHTGLCVACDAPWTPDHPKHCPALPASTRAGIPDDLLRTA